MSTPIPSSAAGRPEGAPDHFHVMAKPTGAICNLDCAYCFFLEKEALYPGSAFRMEEDVLQAYLRQLLRGQTAQRVTIAWQGGEPTLMGLDFFRRAMALVERFRRPGQSIEHTLQTNGTLLDEDWCAFLAEHRFLVGLSLDGPRELHDVYRVDKGGKPSFERVLEGARRLQAHGVALNVLCTVHAANGDHPLEVYRFFRDELGARHLQLIPIVERSTPGSLLQLGGGGDPRARRREGLDGRVSARSVEPAQWGRFLIAIFDEWLRRDVGEVFVQLFDSALGSWLGIGASMCVFRETCGDALALEHNGDLYSCDHFVEPQHLLGNIKRQSMLRLIASPRQRAFGAAKASLPGYCRACEVRFACQGECPRNRFLTTPDGEPGLNYLCAGYRAFFNHVDRPMRRMAELLRRGRYADEIMTELDG